MVESQQVLVDRREVLLADVIQHAVDSLQSMCFERDMTIHWQNTNRTARCWGDTFLLRQAILNVLDNACSFSPAGGRIEVELLEQDDMIHLTIRDQGPGIPQFAQDRIFRTILFITASRPRPEKYRTRPAICA